MASMEWNRHVIACLIGLGAVHASAANSGTRTSCAQGLIFYELTSQNAPGVSTFHDAGNREYFAKTVPLFAISRGMVQSGLIGATISLSGKFDLALGLDAPPGPSKTFSLSLNLMPEVAEALRPGLAQNSGRAVLAVCGDQVVSTLYPTRFSLSGSSFYGLGPFRTLEEAREVARILTDKIDEEPDTADPIITGTSVGSLKLGDTLTDLSRKLDECNPTLMHTHVRETDVTFIHANCGSAEFNAVLGTDGSLKTIEVVGGLAKTVEGFEVGSKIDDLLSRFGSATVRSQGIRVCLTFARTQGIAFCLDKKDSALYRRYARSLVNVGEVTGRVDAILVYGNADTQFDL